MNKKLVWFIAKQKVYFIIGILLIAFVSYFFGTGILKGITSKTSQTSSSTLQVTASFYPLYYFASLIGGDKVNVANITPAGTEPHEYEPTTNDLAKIQNSDLLILNGNFEAWGDKIKDNLEGKKTRIVVAGQDFFTQQLDPHVWLSPQLAKKETEKIADALIDIDPENAKYYQDNERNLEGKLDQLDQTFKQGLVSCKQKNIVTSHAAFGYLASSYGLAQVPIAGLSPDAEPSVLQLTKIAKFAKEVNVKYIFFESLVSPKLSDAIASEIGAKTLVLDPLEGLADNDIKAGKNYFTIMEDNLRNLQLALECN